jgi:hypothetical protein
MSFQRAAIGVEAAHRIPTMQIAAAYPVAACQHEKEIPYIIRRIRSLNPLHSVANLVAVVAGVVGWLVLMFLLGGLCLTPIRQPLE